MILTGDALSILKTLRARSVQSCVTSPPYWGLRDYHVEPSIWDGNPECAHQWGCAIRTPWANQVPGPSGSRKNGPHSRYQAKYTGPFCRRCGAWRGVLGLEPSPELYVQHIVQIFREVRRVIKDDGTLWLNLGDCYATGGGKVGSHPGGGEQGARWAGRGMNTKQPKWPKELGPICQPNRMPIPGLKPKDLVGIPWRVAFALQADGWYLRSDIIWHKPNPMPESVRDRPTKAHEYIFLFAKSERYYYDSDAILEPFQTSARENYPARARITGRGNQAAAMARGNDQGKSGGFPPRKGSGNLIRKVGDGSEGRLNNHLGRGIPFEYAGHGGRNRRTVWTVNTRPFKGAHFATFPPKLIEPCILAGSKPGQNILDIFAGAGTTWLVSQKLGRRFIGIELNPDYANMARRRVDLDIMEAEAA